MEASLASLQMLLRLAELADVEEVANLEMISFPTDEAATKATIRMRISEANDYFRVITDLNGTLIGFINGTCIVTDKIHHDSMTEHQPDGSILVIHSVTIAPEFRRRSIGSLMLKLYVQQISKQCKHINSILLLSKAYLLSFYTSCGFSVVGLSSVEHGAESWFELKLDLSQSRPVLGEQYTVDAFTDIAFGGNPAAVYFEHRDVNWMQLLAAENNLSETAFVAERVGDKGNEFDLRWFTPVTEVKLCGHATLAVAHALYESGRVSVTDQNQLNNIDKSNVVQDSTINFHTASGILTAKKLSDGSIELCFPITPVTEIKSPDVQLIDLIQKSFNLSALDEILFIGESEFDLFIEVKPDSFTLIEPVDMSLLRSLDRRGIILTCIGNPVATVTPHNSDFTSRCFFPRCGIDEDPVTGSAHCALAHYWFPKLKPQFFVDHIVSSNVTSNTEEVILNSSEEVNVVNLEHLIGYQASKRGGIVKVAIDMNSSDRNKVLLNGNCITIMKSVILI